MRARTSTQMQKPAIKAMMKGISTIGQQAKRAEIMVSFTLELSVYTINTTPADSTKGEYPRPPL